ncbi:MAG TPA: AAA family ATPase [Acidimicrobiales bacterium]|nr:AAA family ATPase [Acidimicrobiales bacterium]
MRDERRIAKTATNIVEPCSEPNLIYPGPKANAMEGVVGDAILGNADVSRAQERRRHTRLRRVTAMLALVLGWVVIRTTTGHAIMPSMPMPHWLAPILPMFIIIALLGVVMLGPLLFAGRSPHTLVRPGETAVGLNDLVGIDSIKAEVVRSVNLFLAHQTFRDSMGGSARRGVLFEGPPGTGKTFVAKAMAKEAQVPFLFVSASAFQSMYFGQTNRKIRSFFKALRKYARTEGGAIGFIEEIDAIGASRRGLGGGASEGVTGVVNELLVQLQSFDSPTRGEKVRNAWIDLVNRYLPRARRIQKPQVVPANVLIVGATNRKDDLDPALIRPGRFDRCIYFGLPGRQARADIVAYYLGKKAHAEDLDGQEAVDTVAGMTFGYSPAALERLMDEALIMALTHGRSAMTMFDVAEAKMLVELGVTDHTLYTSEERTKVATHEAGHATVAYFVGQTRQLDVLSIVKRRDSLGLLQHSDTEERFTQSREELNALLQICLGGMVAEEHWFDEVSTGPASDLAAATTIGAQMIGACGMGKSLISVAAAGTGPLSGGLVDKVLADKEARHELDELLQSSCVAARQIVIDHGDVVEALRDALLKRDELVGSEITDVIELCLRQPTVQMGLPDYKPPTAAAPTPQADRAGAFRSVAQRVTPPRSTLT